MARLKNYAFLSFLIFRVFGFVMARQAALARKELPDLYEASVLELQNGLDQRLFSSVDLVKAYLARIEEVNLKGPQLRAVLEINPSALEQATELDKRRQRVGFKRPSALYGIPILIKDNMATVATEGLNTTAGSFSLLGSIVPSDSGVVKKLRAAGAIILGKTNLSEFSHFRGTLASGWSGRGGQSSGAYYPNADPCGSSSGSGVAASIGLAAIAFGTETDGSIICPSGYNNLVGIKPTVGLTSRAGVIPITINQDTVGPMARSVTDAALALSAIAGPDPNDNATLSQPFPVPDYSKALTIDAFVGKRIGIPRHVFFDSNVTSSNQIVLDAFEIALKTIAQLGGIVVDPADIPSAAEIMDRGNQNETIVATVDFKVQINDYFSGLIDNPSGVRSLADLIRFNDDHPDLEKPANYTSQATLIISEGTNGFDDAYFQALSFNHDLGRKRGIDAALYDHSLDALALPTFKSSLTTPSAIAGYPMVTVPLGFYPENTTIGSAGPATVYPAPGIPFGISFFASAFSEFELIGFAYAYEQATQTRRGRMAYPEAIPKTQLVDIMLNPVQA